MQLSGIYQQRLEVATQLGRQEGLVQGKQEGLVQGMQNERRSMVTYLLRSRFGELDQQLLAIIEPLIALSPEEFTPLLLKLSRQELLARFL
ncbi:MULTISPECIES: hypothetical protein [Moorena]|uniref:DUF4351 domain-containing protein n=1 Tax=Moorena bouillonii PNG TaxID=568701 RepID=A0A1U7N4Z0_9CYAN|nr:MULTISPECIES: hypothetical protein [Moorena]OLT60991.1 hypothetical protein BJP37_20195 [Moorena bouillonii PNG]